MGKKGNKGRKSAPRCEGDGEFDEAMSADSFDTFDTFASGVDAGNGDPRSPIGGGGGGIEEGSKKIEGTGGENIEKSVESFKDGVEMLTEKRATTRDSGLRTVIKFMLHSPDLEPVLAMQETILSALIGIVRGKGPEAQRVHALRALSVLCVCIGPDEEEAFRSMRRPLRSVITRSRFEGLRVGAVHALALACFICSSDDDNTSETLELLADVFSGTSDGVEVTDKVCAAALSGWGLLATTLSRSFVATHMTRKHLRVLRELLGSSDMDVRMEAGENLALLHESRIILGLTGAGHERAGGGGRTIGSEDGEDVEDKKEDGEEDDEEFEDDDEDNDEDAVDLTVLWDEVLEEVKGFITDSSKKMSRDTKKQQRRTFRQLFATIGEDEPPEEVVSLQNGSLTVADWAHIKQLNALRSCLQSGFQTQMQSNELLREILGVSKWGVQEGRSSSTPKAARPASSTPPTALDRGIANRLSRVFS